MNLITKTSKIDIKSINNDGEIKGYASVFDFIDSHNDIIQQGAFATSVQQHLKDKSIKLLWQHDQTQPIGYITEIYEDDYGLFIKVQLLHNDVIKAKEVYALIKGNAITSFSIGFKIVDSFHDYERDCRIITNLKLWEVSFVTFPANSQAKITEIKSDIYKPLLYKIHKAMTILNTF